MEVNAALRAGGTDCEAGQLSDYHLHHRPSFSFPQLFTSLLFIRTATMSQPFSDPYDADAIETDLIDPDERRQILYPVPNPTDILLLAGLDDLTAPLAAPTHDRAPLTGNIGQTQAYLTSSVPGEDRRAPVNTLDETVWATLARDLTAVGEKMKQVLWPRYLLGGAMVPPDGDQSAAGFGRGLMGVVGRWPDADVVLRGGMSEGLRDWDLW